MQALIITHVAVKFDDVIYIYASPKRHHDVLHLMHALGIECDGTEEQGFYTNQGTFLDRKQAFYVAAYNGQLNRDPDPSKYQGNELFSEDLW